nr:protein kinase [uncultured Desulfobacter sp.]
MEYQNPHLLERIRQLTGRDIQRTPRIFTDTTQFMSINPGDVMRLGGNDYWVYGNAKEGRFGIDDQPKFWVKKALDLAGNTRKIVKLVFKETFKGCLGPLAFNCVRSAEKEVDVLSATQGHPNFMQGQWVRDSAGNLVRILDIIPGPSLYKYLRDLDMPHRDYFDTLFPTIMDRFLKSLAAIAQIHEQLLHHGDIRADHLLWTGSLKTLAWIDFDYDMGGPAMDVFCLGNVLQQVVGKGRHSLENIHATPCAYPDFKSELKDEDMSLMYSHRVMNLQKLFPYIPDALNDILMRFSLSSEPHSRTGNCYAAARDLLDDLSKLFP